MRNRTIADRLRSTKKSVLLLGARQVGKSTLCKSLSPNLIINLADQETFLEHSKDVGLIKRLVLATPKPRLIFIDEVQRIPSLLNTLESLIDDHDSSEMRFLLTGSSARKLKAGNANLLPGKILHEWLDPLMFSELEEKIDLERALQVGTLPGINLDRHEGKETLFSYVETYLREEIQAEALVRDLGAFARFLDFAALTSGQWLNYSKLSSDSEIPKETLRRYAQLLEDTLVAFRIPPYELSASTQPLMKRIIRQREKLFIFDVGVRNALLKIHESPLLPDRRGAAFEHFMIQQIYAINRAHRKSWNLSSFRSGSGVEVDLMIQTKSQLIGIEMKCAKTVSPSDRKGLRSFERLLQSESEYVKWIVFQGETEQVFDDGTRVLPYLTCLKILNELGSDCRVT